MPLPIQEFYQDKSIQKSQDFFVTFIHDDSGKTTYLPDREKMPEIKNHHVLDIELPMFEFKKEVTYYGPYARTIPIHNSDGYEFSITLEEDDKGTIMKLINYLQRKIIKPNGTYVAPKLNRITKIYFVAIQPNGNEIWSADFDNCYFLKASNPKFDYKTNEAIQYTLTFNCDIPKYFNI